MCMGEVTTCVNAIKLLVNDNKNHIFLLCLANDFYGSLKAHVSDFEILTSWENVFLSLGAEQENAPLYIIVRAYGVHKVPFCPGTILS